MSDVTQGATSRVRGEATTRQQTVGDIDARSDEPLVSVIMNCFNGSQYLREAIDSVVAQTYANWELIFWDNQSTDGSAEIFTSYKDPRLQYFRAPEHSALGQARNLAIQQATGEWLAFLDCDDIWLPDKLMKQIAIINEEGYELGLVYGRMRVLLDEHPGLSAWTQRMRKYQKNTRSTRMPEGWIFERLLAGNFVPLVSALVRTSAFHRVDGINPSFQQAEDFDLFSKVTEKFPARAVQEVVALYRVHGNNATHAQQDIGFDEVLDITRRYMPSRSARLAIDAHCAREAVRRIREGRFAALIDLSAECGGILHLASGFLRVLMGRLR